MPSRLRVNYLLAALLALAAPLAAQEPSPLLARDPPAENDLAIMGTIPIYWGERGDMADLLAGEGPGHWARPVIEQSWRLRPLDYLSAEALSGYRRLLLAQPRGLSAEENVALDAWVRGGGQVLLFADPLMTGHSRYAIGDRRRPQDVALLSPILAHWGLELHFDEAQPEGVRITGRTGDGVPPAIPVNFAGSISLHGAERGCALVADGLMADCTLGAGRATIIADSALFDAEEDEVPPSSELTAMFRWIFGNPVPQLAPPAETGSN
jgi:hypothetical protein